MTVQRAHCTWPTCYSQSALLPLLGLDGGIHLACPFHHQWILRDMEESRGDIAPVPLSERQNPGPFDDIKTYPLMAFCDNPDCRFVVAAKDEEAGELSLSLHKCPYKGGTTRIGLYVSKTKLIEAWAKLDAAVVELKEGSYPTVFESVEGSDREEVPVEMEHPEKTRLKGVCRGMAETLALFMEPHFKTADEISGEAARRYKAKKAGEEYVTPGLEPHVFAKPRTVDYKNGVNKGGSATATATKPAAKANKLGEKEKAAIKFAMESGMFAATDLAKTYGVSEAIINEVCAP